MSKVETVTKLSPWEKPKECHKCGERIEKPPYKKIRGGGGIPTKYYHKRCYPGDSRPRATPTFDEEASALEKAEEEQKMRTEADLHVHYFSCTAPGGIETHHQILAASPIEAISIHDAKYPRHQFLSGAVGPRLVVRA